MRRANEIVALIVGLVAGYLLGTGGKVKVPPDATARARSFYAAHSTEVLIWAALVAIILYLLATRPRGTKARR